MEVIVVDCREPGLPMPVLEGADDLLLRVISAPHTSLGGAYNLGVRAADGDRVLFLRDGAVFEPSFVAAHAAQPQEVAAYSPRFGLLGRWDAGLPGMTSMRMHEIIRGRPELAAKLATPDARFLTAADVQTRFDSAVPSLAFDDYIWERFVPAVARYSPALSGFRLPWLAGLGGFGSVDTSTVFRAGLFHETSWPSEWEIEDPDFSYRLHREGLAIRVVDNAPVFREAHAFNHWPLPVATMIERFRANHGTLAAWWLLRYLAHEDIVGLGLLDHDLHHAAGSRTAAIFAETIDELLGLQTTDLRTWWV